MVRCCFEFENTLILIGLEIESRSCTKIFGMLCGLTQEIMIKFQLLEW